MEQHETYAAANGGDGQGDIGPALDQEEERQQHLCAACHEQERDYTESSRSILCRECREKHIKLRIPLKIKLFFVAVCAIFAVALSMLPGILANFQVYVGAQRHMQAREYHFAYNDYSILLPHYSESVPIILKAADAAMAAQYFGDLAEILDTYLVGKTLNDSQYAHAMVHNNFLDKYYTTLQEFDTINSELESMQEVTDPAEATERFQSMLEMLLSRNDIDKTLVYFYLGSTSQDAETAIAYFGLAVEQDPRSTYPYAYYGNALRRAGRIEEAREAYEAAIAKNANDALSLRGLSILQLLEGQASESLEGMRYAYEIAPYGLYIPDAFLIALCENGMREEALLLLDSISSQGFQADADLQAYLKGEMSLTQYYLG